MSSVTSSTTITQLQRIFSFHGLHETVVYEDGSQFTSALFKEFSEQNNIQHIRSPPYHPQTNEQVERFSNTFTRALLEAKRERTTEEALLVFLKAYRSTPNAATPDGRAPAEILMSRT